MEWKHQNGFFKQIYALQTGFPGELQFCMVQSIVDTMVQIFLRQKYWKYKVVSLEVLTTL